MHKFKVGDIAIMRGPGPASARRVMVEAVHTTNPTYRVRRVALGLQHLKHDVEERDLIPDEQPPQGDNMPETMKLLETALENEAALFLKMISELENEELFDFIRRIAVLEPKHITAGRSATDDILHIAQNVKAIEAAAENFYVI